MVAVLHSGGCPLFGGGGRQSGVKDVNPRQMADRWVWIQTTCQARRDAKTNGGDAKPSAKKVKNPFLIDRCLDCYSIEFLMKTPEAQVALGFFMCVYVP